MARRDPWLLVGLFAFFGLVFLALFGERIAPHEPIYFVPEHRSDPRPYDPGVVFPFGSDILGRFATLSAIADVSRPRALFRQTSA